MDATRARFLAAITERLGEDRIVELHLFSPIRQGVLETGVAVVGAIEKGEEAECGAGEGAGCSAEEEAECGAGEGAECGAGEGAECGAGEGAECGAEEGAIEAADTAAPITDPVPPSLPSTPHHTLPLPLPEDGSARLVVFTATYRLTRKGPDRGKWEFDVAATADAPLATVDVVARGVTQRSKDLTETERFSGEQLRALLQDPQWRTPT